MTGQYENNVFIGADLRNKNFTKEENLVNANFTKADLRGVNFTGINLRGTNFSEANLQGTIFKDADLESANFSSSAGLKPDQFPGAILTGAKLPPEVDFSNYINQIQQISQLARAAFITILSILGMVFFNMIVHDDIFSIIYKSAIVPLFNIEINYGAFLATMSILIFLCFFYFIVYAEKIRAYFYKLPYKFPDNSTLNDKIYPWLIFCSLNLISSAKSLEDESIVNMFFQKYIFPFGLFGIIAILVCIWFNNLLLPVTSSSSPSNCPIYALLASITILLFFFRKSIWLSYKRQITIFFFMIVSIVIILTPQRSNILTNKYMEPFFLYESHDDLFVPNDFTYTKPNFSRLRRMLSINIDNKTIIDGFVMGSIKNETSNITSPKFAELNLRYMSGIFSVLKGENLSEANMYNAYLPKANLNKANLSEANLEKSILFKSTLTDADMSSVNFSKANLMYANFENSKLEFANFFEANLKKASLKKIKSYWANFKKIKCENLNIEDASIRGCHLEGAYGMLLLAKGAKFYECNFGPYDCLYDYNLTEEREGKIEIYKKRDTEPSQSKAIKWPKWEDQKIDYRGYMQIKKKVLNEFFKNLLADEELRGATLIHSDFQNAFFDSSCLWFANFHHCRFHYASFAGAYMWRAKLDGTDARYAYFGPLIKESLQLLKSIPNNRLELDTLKQGRHMITSFKKPEDFNQNNKRIPKEMLKSILIDFDKYGEKIEESPIDIVDASYCSFASANLSHADFWFANLSHAVFFNPIYDEATLIAKADFWHANLTEAQMQHIVAVGAKFVQACLEKTNLQNADLRLADFTEANLTDTNFTGANLGNANLTSATGLTAVQLLKAKSLYKVKGLNPELMKELQKQNPSLFTPLKS